ncbi:MAG: YbjN domain-containing protein [Actinobacteria bacterium]|nr:YbjN domain-containing protein [Actinomycetota bacterium]
MTTIRVRRQVAAILEGNGLRSTSRDDGFSLRFSSAIVHLTLGMLGKQVLIQLRSNVLCDLPSSATGRILTEINRLNCASFFGKWVYYVEERLIALEYDLLGDHLQEEELMTALATVARLADRHDDILQGVLGGRKAVE